jgi:hypothetical protein
VNKETQSKDRTAVTPPDVKPNTGQGAQPNPAAVGAGPGNQVLDNETSAAQQETTQTDVKPGAQPDGAATTPARQPRNEGIEQADGSPGSSSIE